MNITVLRPDDGSAMMKLVKYELVNEGTEEDNSGADVIYHNHHLVASQG